MIYEMPSGATGLEVLDALAGRYPTKREEHPAESLVYHDTFDWRLFRAGILLTSVPGRAGGFFERPARSTEGARVERVRIGAVPAFVRDLPEGPLLDELTKIVEMRRLLPVVEVDYRTWTLHVLDDERKTVVRVRLRDARAGLPEAKAKTAIPARLRVLPLRGYRQEHDDLVRVIEEELGLEPSAQDELTSALAVLGRRPCDYLSKPAIALEPSARSDDAAKQIHRSLLGTLLANEDGTRRDLDSEFLHDFRVSVRRTRSALTQLKLVFPGQVLDRFRAEFSWLGGATGPTRDLDVYLLKIDDYEAALPEAVRTHLEPLRDFLKRHQQTEQLRLVKVLGSKRYRNLIEAWRQFLSEPAKSSAANAARPIVDLASERIWKAWRRLWKKGRVIGPETPAQALHELRIDGKKLRYLLEFFRGLYDGSEVDPLIKALKQLQDNLGDFNDFEVQQEKLREFAHQMQQETAVPADTFLAMGELVATLRRLQADERLKFADRFARFTEHPHRQSFRRLFGRRA